jgi:hypothetical protein
MKRNENIVPFFRVKKTSSTTGKVKCHGIYNRIEEKLHDREMEIDLKDDSPFYREYYGKHTLYIGKINGYDVTVKFYECNLSGHFLLANENYPLFYFGVYYKNKFVGGSLMSYFYMFSMNEDTKKYLTRPTSPKNKKNKKDKKDKKDNTDNTDNTNNMMDGRRYAARYVNSTLYGNYAFDMSMADKLKDSYKEHIKEYLVNKNSDKYGNPEDYYPFFETINEKERNYASSDYIKNKFMEVINNPKFINVIEIALISREKERREGLGIDSDEEYLPNQKDSISLINEDELIKRFEKDLEL